MLRIDSLEFVLLSGCLVAALRALQRPAAVRLYAAASLALYASLLPNLPSVALSALFVF